MDLQEVCYSPLRDPQELMRTALAQDPDVDLVVSCVQVDSHASTITPSILAGKDIFVEWPLEANLFKATELFNLAQKHRVRNVMGLQAGHTPIVQQIKTIVDSGRIGKVNSSSNVSNFPDFGATQNQAVKYFADREVGGNMVSIHFGHAMEYMKAGM